MIDATGTLSPGPLFEHALRLHRLHPDEPPPHDGQPFPDEALHRGRGFRRPVDQQTIGQDVARLLDDHFARTGSTPGELADAFHDFYIAIHQNDHLIAAAERADQVRVRHTGRWLVRHGTDRCAVTVGLALLAAVGTVDDIPLIQTIGLLSNRFGPLAAAALERLPGGVYALLWLADRVSGWGRVYVVEALCRLDDPIASPWLLRKPCDGEFLNGYFAGRVAVATRLHDALDEFDDPDVVDHTGRLLCSMSYCEGMGATLSTYEHSAAVLAAHARQTALLPPTLQRIHILAMLAQHLTSEPLTKAGCTAAQQQELLATYLSTLDLDSWKRAAQVGLAADDQRMLTLAKFLDLHQ